MTSPDPDEAESPLADPADYLRDRDDLRRRLPAVVGRLDSDDETVRLRAAWTCCLAAVQWEGTVEYLVRRLTDRLGEGGVSLELTQALDYIAARYPETVEETLREIGEAGEDRDALPFPRVGDATRSYYYGRSATGEGASRVQPPSVPDGDPRQTYVIDGEADTEPAAEDGSGAEEDGEIDENEDADTNDDGDADDGGDTDDTGYMGNPREVVQRTEDLTPIARRSRFQTLHVVSSRERGRYGQTYEALVGSEGGERSVVFRVLRKPDGGDRAAYRSSLRAELDRWAELDGHRHVVTVLDWGVEPVPWLATRFTGKSLADRGRVDVARALRDARRLADGVAHLHQHDAVHGGIDPKNVAYPDEVVEGGDLHPPLLDNVGLMHAFRHHFQPASCLDPRYAAPEYFDRGYGRVDHLTDIYGLGAALFRLFTGRPPYRGTFPEVRAAVTESGTPSANAAVDGDLPSGIDELVSKAMATQKLRRYETVEHLRQELRGLEAEASDGV